MDELMLYLKPLFLTILFECISAMIIFGIRDRRDMCVVLLANIMTNPVLVYVSSLMVYHLGIDAGRLVTYLILEPMVVLAEYVIYRKHLLKDVDYLKMSIILNLISIMGGLICQRLI